MSSFWSFFISIITLGLIVAIYLLLRWCLANKTGVEEGDDMHHDFDGIIELNNGLPHWWTIMFKLCIAWGFVYLLLYPGLGNFEGLLGWKSSMQDIRSLEESKQAVIDERERKKDTFFGFQVQYNRELDKAEEYYAPLFDKHLDKSYEQLTDGSEESLAALEIGKRLFMQNCAQCHGSTARGNIIGGFPNLTDNDWLYGGSEAKIKETLMLGRSGFMPDWKESLGERGIKEVVHYVMSLSGRKHDSSLAQEGKVKFATVGITCVSCHGADGKGNQTSGAPNLTDGIWLYGGTEDKLTDTLTYGRNGVMPSFKDTLGEKKIHLVGAYVYSLSKEQP